MDLLGDELLHSVSQGLLLTGFPSARVKYPLARRGALLPTSQTAPSQRSSSAGTTVRS